jgi:hypothetical protein
MSNNLRTSLILVNDRAAGANQQCAVCDEIIKKGYVRSSQTRLIHSDPRCVAGGTYLAAPIREIRARKVS